jgi:hypothetical protein
MTSTNGGDGTAISENYQLLSKTCSIVSVVKVHEGCFWD